MVTFETKCWQGDWERILTTGWLEEVIERCRDPFERRVLHINNVADPEIVARHARRKVEKGVLTGYHVVADHADAALESAGLTAESLGRGYYFSIAELVAIHLCETEYLLHFAGDCIPEAAVDWIPAALAVFAEQPRVRVANLCWNRQYRAAREEAFTRAGDFDIGYGFSDQCYLIPAAPFRAPIYHERHPDTARYPTYGGESFEKRVDAWMRTRRWYRATYRLASYLHIDARHAAIAEQLTRHTL
jgi:hypothetical protein